MVDNSNNISTKRTITSHLKSLKTIKKIMTYGILKPSPSLGQAQKCGGVKPVNGIPNPRHSKFSI